MILLPLLVALNAAAADAPAVLKPARTFPAGVEDTAFTLIATPTESSINLWSLETGRQIGHVDVPSYERKHEKDAIEIVVHSVRTDLKLVLASVRHWVINPDWKASAPDASNYWEDSKHATWLLSLEDGVKPIKLWSGGGGCGSYGIQTFCPGTVFRDGQTRILADRPEVIVHGIVSASGQLEAFRKTLVQLAFDLKGRKIFENETSYRALKLTSGTEKDYPPVDDKSLDYVAHDAQSCRVIRRGKTASYLEGCVESDYPGLSADGKTAMSNYDGAGDYKVWDAETGARTILFKAPARDGWSFGGIWYELQDGRIAGVFGGPNGVTEIQVWNPRSGRLVAAGSGPEFKGAYNLRSGGGRLLFDRTDHDDKGADIYRTVVVDLTDTPAAPAPAAAASKLDVDELPAGTAKLDPDAYAVVIGVEKYRSAGVPVVDYAARDARTVAAYLGRMGFDPKNVVVLTDAEAGKVDFEKYFGKWLPNRVGPKSRVFVYYAGHGAPNPATGAGYLMPYEADPSYLDESAYPVSQLYDALGKLPTKDITVVLDACFSGQGERSLIAKGTRPLVAVQRTPGPANAAVLAAASGSQISASDHEARHGLLTYHLLAGLHGAADADGDGRITTREAFAYARPAVERAAKLQNVEQTPTVTGDSGAAGERVWLSAKKP